MNVLLKYLSLEAIENCVTCLNYHFDQVIFFGYKKVIDEENKNIKSFLIKKTNVNDVIFLSIDNLDLNNLEFLITSRIIDDNHNYFDLTGCEGLCQVAIINVAYKRNIPMHIFDVNNNTFINIDDDINGSIFNENKLSVNINIDDYIDMLGGCIYKRMEIESKHNDKSSIKLIEIMKKHKEVWTYFSNCINRIRNKENLNCYCENLTKLLNDKSCQIKYKDFINILNELKDNDLIYDYKQNGMYIRFSIKDEKTLALFIDGGALFEMEVYNKEKSDADDCKIGVYLDWDGMVPKETVGNVINEIDVLRLDGYILTFISCKNTNAINKQFLYELESVARRFGGKYTKMKLVCTCDAAPTDIERAKLLGIEIEKLEY